MKKEMIFSGIVKKKPDCGISMKNYFFINKFHEYYDKMWVVGINKTGWHLYFFPFKILEILVLAIFHPKAQIVISSNTWEANFILSSLVLFGMEKRCFYWVPGGVFHSIVKERFKLSTFQKLNKLYVQSPSIVKGLEKLGFNNAICVPNSKRIDYYPIKKAHKTGIIKFVFLSRIHPDKGCGMIIDCAKQLNLSGFQNKFTVDFYGKIFPEYQEDFMNQVNSVSNVKYCGYLNLTKKESYDRLAEYDVMLFPTYWWGEGFPGVVIDAYIAGLPIIASDWNCNCDVIDKDTGIIIRAKAAQELFDEMKNTIEGTYDLTVLSHNCQEKAKQYDNEFVLSQTNLKRIGLL